MERQTKRRRKKEEEGERRSGAASAGGEPATFGEADGHRVGRARKKGKEEARERGRGRGRRGLRPLDKQTDTESAGRTSSAGGRPSAAAAFISRAPAVIIGRFLGKACKIQA